MGTPHGLVRTVVDDGGRQLSRNEMICCLLEPSSGAVVHRYVVISPHDDVVKAIAVRAESQVIMGARHIFAGSGRFFRPHMRLSDASRS